MVSKSELLASSLCRYLLYLEHQEKKRKWRTPILAELLKCDFQIANMQQEKFNPFEVIFKRKLI